MLDVANDNGDQRTIPELDRRMAAIFVASVIGASLRDDTDVQVPLRVAQAVAGQLRLSLGGLIDG